MIAALGKYRQVEMIRASRGQISNRHAEKHALVDLYQDRFEALQALESLVNQEHSAAENAAAFAEYVTTLRTIQQQLAARYFNHTLIAAEDTHAIATLHGDLQNDIDVAVRYSGLRVGNPSGSIVSRMGRALLRGARGQHTLRSESRATGVDSVLTFVKCQMIRNLREMQNLNQNLSYSFGSKKYRRGFAATRGDLNSFIEDAEKSIERFEADPHNGMTPEHHGNYGQGTVIYDSAQHLTLA